MQYLKRYTLLILLLFVLVTTVFALRYRNTAKRFLLKTYKEYCGNTHSPKEISDSGSRNHVWGIDISHHQKSINWQVLVQKNKPDFIFFKATEGSTHTDTRYREYVKEAREHGILVGAYHFFSYQSPGAQQAKNFIKNAALRKGDLYPVLDVEFKKNMPSKTWIVNEIEAFCNEIKKEYGVYPIIYCECDYYNKYLKERFKNYNYWISDLYWEPRCNYIFWQYTEAGQVEGIGKIDNNRLNPRKDIHSVIL
jgi:lysozyme